MIDKRFFLEWLKHPLQVASPTISGPDLAKAMARAVPIKPTASVIELGGGTGAVTSALLAAGVKPSLLVTVEFNPVLCGMLRERFPGIHVLRGNAADLKRLVAPLGLPNASAVVSALPILQFKKDVQQAILDQSFELMEPGAPFIQLTYSLFSPLPRRELGIAGSRKERVFKNIPPASVWQYRQANGHALQHRAG